MAVENTYMGGAVYGGIQLSNGFDLHSEAPLDSRAVVPKYESLQALIDGNAAYQGMIVYDEETKKTYQAHLVNGSLVFEEFSVNLDGYATTEDLDAKLDANGWTAIETNDGTGWQGGEKGGLYSELTNDHLHFDYDDYNNVDITAQDITIDTEIGKTTLDGAKIKLIANDDNEPDDKNSNTITRNSIVLSGTADGVTGYNKITPVSIKLVNNDNTKRTTLTAEGIVVNDAEFTFGKQSGTLATTEEYDTKFNDVYSQLQSLNNSIGEISSAFDELHEYAQNLISGVSE